MSEQPDKVTDTLDVAASGAPGVAAVAAQPPRTRFAALDVPVFRWYWVASWISSTGDGMENVILNVLVVQLAGTAAPFWLGMMVFAHWLPFTLFSLYGGVLADRHDNRKVQLGAQVLLMAAAIGQATATLAGFVTTWWIFALVLLHGFAGAIGGPAQQTLIHAMVGPSKLLSAVSLNSTARQFSQVVGPALAGFIVVAFGPGTGFLINALTFVPLLVLLVVIRVPRLGATVRQPLLASLRGGLGFVRDRPLIATLIAVEMISVIFIGHTFNSFLVLFAYDQLHVDALGYSFLLVGSGIGAVSAALYLGYARSRGHGGVFIVVAAMCEMAAIFVFAFSRSYALSFLLLLVVGAAAVLTQSLTNTKIQLSAPNELRGRVMGAYTFATQGMRVLNGPILGGAAIALGAPAAVAGAAATVFAAMAVILARVKQLRES
ncbi:MAG TPA: MFS transporter [Candidatus Limnocylindria bacterium]|jgi:MFS family permease|nr:MFS transporter [Candidatus Limnocylindria bacterium]